MLRRDHFIPLTVLAAAAFPAGLRAQQLPPTISYSDIDSGPNTGGQNNAGAFVTIYGHRFGVAQGASFVSTGGGLAASYPFWSDTQITFQLGAQAQSGGITVTTAAGVSAELPFTVRPGNIYFVSTAGNDSAAGTFSAPWKTLLQARNSMLPGDITYAEDGVTQSSDDGEGWDAAFTLRPAWCGGSGLPRAVLAYPGATVTIGNANGSTPGHGLRSVDFSADGGACGGGWTFGEIQFRGIGPADVNGPSSSWRFVGNDITCPQTSGSDGGGACFETTLASNVKFYGNRVHDAGTANASALFQGVYFSTDSNHIDMGWNTIANVRGCRGVQVHSSPLGSGYPDSGYPQYDISIHHNLIHDTQCDGIIVDTIDPSKGAVSVYGNVIYNAGEGPDNPEQTGNWACINVPGNVENGTSNGGTVEIFNNTMYACGTFASPPYGDANTGIEEGGGATNLYVNATNNIIYQVATSLFPSGVPYMIGWDPTISNGGDVCVTGSACPWLAGTNNLLWGSGSTAGYPGIVSSVVGDPSFRNPAAFDFHLSPSSPAGVAGAPSAMTVDFDGVPVGRTYPIGAYAVAVSGPALPVSVTVSPFQVSLGAMQTQQFMASVSGIMNGAVTWSISPAIGNIGSGGLYTAPS
ncbi:MAG: IPT/TIG domain-containing protein, partial [Acidobacteriota bacterium]|nr:IPT/TIG domain-containing protein [Acidobacteriota bacterium]